MVFGADDPVLGEFTELHVVIVWEGVPVGQTKHLSYNQNPEPSETRSHFYFMLKLPSKVQRAESGELQEAEVSSSFPSCRGTNAEVQKPVKNRQNYKPRMPSVPWRAAGG